MQRAEVDGVEVVAMLMESMFLADIAWIGVGVPVLLVLSALTFAGTVRSRRAALREASEPGVGTPPTTPLARPARVLAVSLVALGAALGALAFISVMLTAPEGALGTLLGLMMVAGMVALSLLIAAFVIVLGVIARQVFTKRFAAGRDTRSAYILMATAHAGLLVLALTAGVFIKMVA